MKTNISDRFNDFIFFEIKTNLELSGFVQKIVVVVFLKRSFSTGFTLLFLKAIFDDFE